MDFRPLSLDYVSKGRFLISYKFENTTKSTAIKT